MALATTCPQVPTLQPPTYPVCLRHPQWPPPRSPLTCQRHHPPAQGPRPAPSDCHTRYPPSPRRDCRERATQESAKRCCPSGAPPRAQHGGEVCLLGSELSAQASPAPNVLAAPRDGDSVCARDQWVILEAIDAISQVLLLHTLLALCQRKRRASGLSSKALGLPLPTSAAGQLTGTLHGDLQLPTACTLRVHLEVSSLLHPYTLRLQAPANGTAGAWVTCCRQRAG